MRTLAVIFVVALLASVAAVAGSRAQAPSGCMSGPGSNELGGHPGDPGNPCVGPLRVRVLELGPRLRAVVLTDPVTGRGYNGYALSVVTECGEDPELTTCWVDVSFMAGRLRRAVAAGDRTCPMNEPCTVRVTTTGTYRGILSALRRGRRREVSYEVLAADTNDPAQWRVVSTDVKGHIVLGRRPRAVAVAAGWTKLGPRPTVEAWSIDAATGSYWRRSLRQSGCVPHRPSAR